MHKVFISYHHSRDREYNNRLSAFGKRHSIFIDRSVDTGTISESGERDSYLLSGRRLPPDRCLRQCRARTHCLIAREEDSHVFNSGYCMVLSFNSRSSCPDVIQRYTVYSLNPQRRATAALLIPCSRSCRNGNAGQYDGGRRCQVAAERGCRLDGHIALDRDLACTGKHFRGVVSSLHPQQHFHAHVEGLFDA